jgi:uncharacterized glyoxalase superfamily protein PhnB/uncharacterized protein YbjT (DUF2867 family)
MITVMGATGNTGKKITEKLLAAGEKVRALGRSEARLADLKRAGAEVLTGDASDATFLSKAFRGADAVYTMLPTDRRSHDCHAAQDRQGEAIVRAIRDSGVRYVVALSSLGADVGEGTGLIAGLHAQEERLKRIKGTNVYILRPAFFFENFRAKLELVKHDGIVGDCLAPDLAIPMVATRDIADVAAQALESRDWKGVAVRELLGPRDLTCREATRIVGQHIGKPDLEYIQFSEDDMMKALLQAGLSRSFAGLYVEMTRAFREGRIKPREGRAAENTTPTRLEDFASELARAYEALEREGTVSGKSGTEKKEAGTRVKAIPAGHHTVTPYLTIKDAVRALEFYTKAFGAIESFRLLMPDGRLGHAEIRLGDSVIMLSDEFLEYGGKAPRTLGGSPVSLHLYVEDVDAFFERALAGGAKELKPVKDQFYGDRSGELEDPFGHRWWVATHKEDVAPEELQKRAQAMFGRKCNPA